MDGGKMMLLDTVEGLVSLRYQEYKFILKDSELEAIATLDAELTGEVLFPERRRRFMSVNWLKYGAVKDS